jgi:hypothetical protein
LEIISPWKTREKAIRNKESTLYMALYSETRVKVAEDKEFDCIIATLIEDQEKNGLMRKIELMLGARM